MADFQAFSVALLTDNMDGTYTIAFVLNSGDMVNGEEFTKISGSPGTDFNVGDQLDQNNFNGPGADVTYLGTFAGGIVAQFGSSAPSLYIAEANTTAVTVGQTFTPNAVSFTPCFLRGTMIETRNGAVAIENLTSGDEVLTRDGTYKPITLIGRRSIDPETLERDERERQLPVRIAAGSLGPNRPLRDLWLSPEHAVCIGDVLIPARALVNGGAVTQPERSEDIDYFHIMLDTHDVIYAEGQPCETFRSDDASYLAFANWFEFFRLGNEKISSAPCLPVVETGVAAALARKRIDAMSGSVTRDAEVALWVDGAVLSPSEWDGPSMSFDIPEQATSIAITSAVTSPQWFGAADRRRLGAGVVNLRVDGAPCNIGTLIQPTEWHEPRDGLRWMAQGRAEFAAQELRGTRLTFDTIAAECGYPAVILGENDVEPA